MQDQLKISKLPKWAQDHIRTVEREREVAVKALRDMEGSQTPTKIWIEDRLCLGEGRGPASVTQYLDARYITFEIPGGTVDVGWDSDGCFVVRSDHRPLLIKPVVSNVVEVRIESK